MNKKELESLLDRIAAVKKEIKDIEIELDDEILVEMAMDSLSALERLRVSLKMQLKYRKENENAFKFIKN